MHYFMCIYKRGIVIGKFHKFHERMKNFSGMLSRIGCYVTELSDCS